MRKADASSPFIVAALLAGALAAPALAQTDPPAPAVRTVPAPRLAPGVKPQAAWEAPPANLVVANPTPIFSDISPYSSQTGQLERIGEPVRPLAKVAGWDWYLVGRDGVGIGYVSRSVLKPAGS